MISSNNALSEQPPHTSKHDFWWPLVYGEGDFILREHFLLFTKIITSNALGIQKTVSPAEINSYFEKIFDVCSDVYWSSNRKSTPFEYLFDIFINDIKFMKLSISAPFKHLNSERVKEIIAIGDEHAKFCDELSYMRAMLMHVASPSVCAKYR